MFNIVTKEMQQQMDLEFAQLDAGKTKALVSIAEGYNRSIDSGQLDMVIGKKMMFELYSEINKFLIDMVKKQLEVRKKSTFYKNFYEPICKKYEKYEEGSYTKGKYTHPEQCLSYIVLTELNKAAIDNIPLTTIGRNIYDKFYNTYNIFETNNDFCIIGVIQFVRTYILSSDYYKEITSEYNKDSTIYVCFKNDDFVKSFMDYVGSTIEPTFQHKPMICEPRPHTNLIDNEGGYYVIESPLLKRKDFEVMKNENFIDVDYFKAVNELQNTKWQVNVPFLNWLKHSNLDLMNNILVGDIDVMQKEYNVLSISIRKEVAKQTDYLFQCRKNRKEAESEEDKNHWLNQAILTEKHIKTLEKELSEQSSHLGKTRCGKATLEDAEIYGEYPYFYQPIFIDQRSRFYTYNTTLSFQGSNFAKSIVQTHHKERMTDEGLEQLLILFGGMIEGYSKKKNHVRLAKVQEVLKETNNFATVIEDKNYDIISTIDEDEVFTALGIMFEVYNHFKNKDYKTGILGYIDATSSAIQIQALIQKCKISASLTNLIMSDTDDLPDAYLSVANVCHDLCEDIAKQSDTDLIVELSAFFIANYPDRYQRIAC